MNTKILRKLSERIRFVENEVEAGTEFVVERKNSETSEWEISGKSLRIDRAIIKKHNEWYAELSRLNYRGRLLSRRKQRSKK